jgi:DNA methylase
MKQWHYEKNIRLLEHKVNRTFDEVLAFSEQEFRNWVIELRSIIVDLWDNEGQPPVVGRSTEDILKDFDQLETFKTEDFLLCSEASSTFDVIYNTYHLDTAVNQWFPTMMRTKINSSDDITNGKSIYDYMSQDELLESVITRWRRQFKLDSYYCFSKQVPANSKELDKYFFSCKTGREWIVLFEQDRPRIGTHDYWISPLTNNADYSGYQSHSIAEEYLTLGWTDILTLKIPRHCMVNVNPSEVDQLFAIRVYQKDQRIFPPGFQAFRTSTPQAPVNFRPLTAKLVYERLLKKLGVTKAVIWDPSAGWGGRIIGAMSIRDGYKVHYIGTDPNTDHNTENNRTKYHEVADFYNRLRAGLMPGHAKLRFLCQEPHTYEIYQCGSEEMSTKEPFQQYKGKIDIVFTSPPYFAKELYSEDAGQSAKKFSDYESWRDGFLKPTLETAVEWLRPGGIIAWNIADATFSKKTLPLEADSCQILENLGMKQIEVLKMLLAPAPGANRTKIKNGKKQGTSKNNLSIRLNRKLSSFKYEPIFIYQKPDLHPNFGAKKSQKKTILPYLEQRICALEVENLLIDFIEKVESAVIKPQELRSIYKELIEKKVKDIDDYFFHYFNSGFTELSQKGWHVRNYSNPPMFIKSAIGNRKVNSLVGKYVLLQRDGSSLKIKKSPYYAWARILDWEPPDEKSIWVTVETSSEFAESYNGLTIDVHRDSVIRIEDSPVPLDTKTNH